MKKEHKIIKYVRKHPVITGITATAVVAGVVVGVVAISSQLHENAVENNLKKFLEMFEEKMNNIAKK